VTTSRTELRPEAAAGLPRVDFQREVVCLLGLPLDTVDLADAVEAVRGAALAPRPCSVVTPNLNWLVASRRDEAFRDSVTHADLSLPDGMPLVWLARLLGLPLRERVAGADLFEAMRRHPGPPVTVFFFGGPDGVAQAACERLNAGSRGLRCVGFDSPGFGSLAEISGAERIARINASGAQFLVASLGAKKGQAWLEHNRARLAAPVRCHLGAVVNFVAGTVRRAPAPVRRLGLEWLWRIVEEPSLWRRYAGDGLVLLRLLFTHVLPLALARRPGPEALTSAALHVHTAGGTCTLRLSGAWARANLQPLRSALAHAAAAGATRLVCGLREVSSIDSAFIGLLMLAPRAFPLGVALSEVPPPVARQLRWHGAEWLLRPSGGARHA
jgi:N-acetylglucosaminyldiphosphoundecaprenol N-acetyl-beta-D-mannosaminyltransferase